MKQLQNLLNITKNTNKKPQKHIIVITLTNNGLMLFKTVTIILTHNIQNPKTLKMHNPLKPPFTNPLTLQR